MRLMELHLDSSALNKVVREGRLQVLIRAASDLGARLYVASPVIDELLAGDDDAHVRRVAKALLQLLDSGCFRISPGLEEVLKRELQEPVVETPMATKAFRRNYRNGLKELLGSASPASLLVEIRQRMMETKRHWGPEDAKIAAAVTERLEAHGIRARDIGAELADLSPATLPTWMLELVLHQLLARTDLPAAQITEQPGRYPFLLAWAALLFTWVAALGVPADQRTQHAVLAGMKPHRNDFLDAQIAAEAARADIFIAEDKGLIARCEVLRAGACIQFRSMSLEGFLGRRVRATSAEPPPSEVPRSGPRVARSSA